MVVFHLNNRGAKSELNVHNSGNPLPSCPISTYLGLKLGRSLTFCYHLKALCKKTFTQVGLFRRLARSGWGAGAKTLWISALYLVYSTAEYCAPVWCHSMHTCLIDSILSDTLHIVTGCLYPIPTEDLPVLTGIQPAQLHRLGVVFSLGNHAIHDSDHVLQRQLVGQQNVLQERLRSRRPFVYAAWKLLGSLSELDIHGKQWIKHKWNTGYLESTSRVHASNPRVSSRPLGMSLPRTSWVMLNHLQTGVGRFTCPCTNWVLLHHQIGNVVPLSKLQITLYLHVSYIMYQEEHEVCRFGMMQLDVSLTPPPPASNLGSAAARGGIRIDP